MRLATYAERYPTCKEAIEWHEQPEMYDTWKSLRNLPSATLVLNRLMFSAMVAIRLIPDGPMASFFNQMQTKEFFDYLCEKLRE